MNTIYYGDNLSIIKKYIKDESIDLIYLDPPFNSKKQYNIIYKETSGKISQAQSLAFDDTWKWISSEIQKTYEELIICGDPDVTSTIKAFISMFGKADITAYLVMMTARLMELHRVLKSTGSIYTHCDPTASHYLKIMMDAIFGPQNFQNEIIWKYSVGGKSSNHFGRKHDTILFYTKSKDWFFNDKNIRIPFTPHKHSKTGNYGGVMGIDKNGREYVEKWGTGKKKKYRYYIDKGKIPEDVWTDIQSIQSQAKERTGYPTQKPLVLIERIIKASCPKEGIVFDPFCGCGTALVASQKLNRKWIGIDITYLAVNVLQQRFEKNFPGIKPGIDFKIEGEPEDLYASKQLAEQNKHQFAIWAITKIGGKPNKKKSGDKGVDGFYDFFDNDVPKRGLIQVTKEKRGGGPKKMRDFCHVIKRDKASIGIYITLDKSTKDMKTEAVGEGFYTDAFGVTYPKIQIITIEEILSKKKLNIPPPKRY